MQPADVQNNSGMKSRVQMNRKRHHHLTEATDKDPWIDAQHPDKGQGHLSGHQRPSGAEHMNISCKCDVLFLISQTFPCLPGAAVRWGRRQHLLVTVTYLYTHVHLSRRLFSRLWPIHQRVSSSTPCPRTHSPQWKF